MEAIEAATTIERILIEKAKMSRTPINGSIELLPLCNMNCDMCYVRLDKKEQEAKGRIRSVDEWLKIGEDMAKAGVLFLLLTGGEPLMYPGFKELYIGLKKLGLIITINTNGTLINEEWADFFKENKPRRINITLYGGDDRAYEELCHYKGGFEKVISGIRLLRERDVDVKLSVSVTKANCSDLDKIYAIAKELDVPARADAYMMAATRERDNPFDYESRLEPNEAGALQVNILKKELMGEELTEYFDEKIKEIEGENQYDESPRGLECLAGSCSFTINWQGELHPCVILTRPSASVFEAGFINAWNQVQDEVQKIRINPKCSTCNLRSVCRTCAACAKTETGSYDGVPEYMCNFAKGFYEEVKVGYRE